MIPLKALQNQVKILVDDLREQVSLDDMLRFSLEQEFGHAHSAQRTAGTFESWLEDVLDQAGVAWVLGCVFVRFCEDNKLVNGLWIGGPTGSAPVDRAVQERQAYLIAHHDRNDRHWLREGFTHLGKLGATGKIFDQHNPLWRFDISGQAAEDLSDFFRRGDGFASVESPGLDTRFLGDLYQNLSAHARETYALLQTPDFVEEFILDRTFEPAYREFGLAATKVVDPTCGSGHFLLGAFDRLITRWKEREPATEVRVLVQRALDQVTGVDVNPFAVAIARFRLMIAALKAGDHVDLETAPAFALRLAVGDSLLGWGRKSTHQGQLGSTDSEGGDGFAYFTEDGDDLAEFLRPNQYTVVVGNPPYITVKDKAQNELYRTMYSACSGKYALTVPFAQLFFKLAKRGDHGGDGAGFVGQITANSFMKREFGKKLINQYFAHEVELVNIIDTSGAYIPGHGTPTVLLVGRNRLVSSRYSGPIRTVLGIKGEDSQPKNPAEGAVWLAIIDQIDRPGSESVWISVIDQVRDSFSSYPWSLSGGGASSLVEAIEHSGTKLASIVDRTIGPFAITGDDEVFVASGGPPVSWSRNGAQVRPLVTGDGVRDWQIQAENVLWPYTQGIEPILRLQQTELFWPHRSRLRAGLIFGQTREERDMEWHEYAMLSLPRVAATFLIPFACVVTHNHFSLSAAGPVFNRHAPVIKLPETATKDDHLSLLGVLNSSTACFWLKQVSHAKTGADNSSGGGNRWSPEAWYSFYEFTGTKLLEFPLPSVYPLERGRIMDGLAQRLFATSPAAVASSGSPTRKRLEEARAEWESIRGQMIAVQEEIDWEVYNLYELVNDELTATQAPELQFGERAFEIRLARKMAVGEVKTQWFTHHGATPITELPAHWPADYRALVERRIAVIESDRNIGLIERPECKRRWATKGWDTMQVEALRDWLLDRLESSELWHGAPVPLSVAQLADKIRHDDDFRAVLDLWVGSDQHDLVKTISKLIADEYVPYLPASRYKPAGLRKRVQWERTWELQRREDAGEELKDIPVPPKYTSADFLKPSYWRNRGKLDVPKERFVSYPKAGRDGDNTELLGWAGWDHLAQAQALATIYLDRKNQAAWPAERLLPLLAGLAELEPWLRQWHSDPRPGFPGTPAQFFTGLVDTELAALGSDRPTLTALRGLA
jgi:hypothetical protein